MKILLHTCCAPCLIYPLKTLKEKGFEVTALFYNPNIHPLSEYNARKKAVQDYGNEQGLEVIFPEYAPQEFFRAVNMMEHKLERCPICWFGRLSMTADIGKEKGFTHFTSTLLASPYQDQDLLKKIGLEIEKSKGIVFYYEDFRSGFRKAHHEAKARGIYCQKYCGCVYSEIERNITSKK